MTNGRDFGGVPFSRGQIYAILKNPIYIGEIPHHDQRHKGLHKPIVDRQVWDATQTLLAGHVPGLRRRTNTASGSLLAGLIIDDTGEKLIAAHACKAVLNGGDNGKVRYRYMSASQRITSQATAGPCVSRHARSRPRRSKRWRRRSTIRWR